MLAATLGAQEFRATITGRVSDSQNAVVAAVKIIATETGTQAKYETVSGADGQYTIPFLSPGKYRLTAESSGLATGAAK